MKVTEMKKLSISAALSFVLIALIAAAAAAGSAVSEIAWNSEWRYADRSAINSGAAKLYKVDGARAVVAINAGHGTKDGAKEKTLSHPDGTPKVTGGTTAEGAVYSIAVSDGMVFPDGTPEPVETLRLAERVRDELIERNISVLMLRTDGDARLDNVARTVMANANADIHISLHFDGTDEDKGLFCSSMPENDTYRSMEPVASHWQEHEALVDDILAAARNAGIKIWKDGRFPLDLTQTSYSTIPTATVEVGDKASGRSDEDLARIARAVADGAEDFLRSRMYNR